MRKNLALLLTVMSVLVLVVGMAVSVYVGTQQGQEQRDSLRQRVDALANAMAKDPIKKLSATEDDIDSTEYATLKSTLQDVVDANPDIEFVYITKLRDDAVYFVADSEPEGSEDESPAGQHYEEVDAAYKQVHIDGMSSVTGPTTDRWGTWMSGAAAIVVDDNIEAVFGMDIPAGSYRSAQINSGMAVAVPTVLVAILFVLAAAWVRSRERELRDKLAMLSSITDGIQAPLESVSWAAGELESMLDSNPTAIGLLEQLKRGTEEVKHAASDILSTTTQKTKRESERVDVVAVVYDSVNSLQGMARNKHVTLRFSDGWPFSYVVSSNTIDLSRLVKSMVLHAIERSTPQTVITISLIVTNAHWKLKVEDASLMNVNELRVATQQAIVGKNMGKLAIERNQGTQVTASFMLNGDELMR